MTLIRKDFRGITDMYLDTAAYNLDPSFNYYLQDPKELDQRRLRAYKYFMDFYDGKHWDDVVGSVTMSEWNPAYGYYYAWNEDFNRRTWNVSKNIVDKLVSWLCQEEWKVKIPVALQEDQSETDTPAPSSGNLQQPGPQSGQQQNDNSPDPSPDQNTDFPSTDPNSAQSQSPKQKAEDDENQFQALLEDVWAVNGKHEIMYDIAYSMCITGDAYVKLSYDPDFYADGAGELVLQLLDARTVMPYWDGHNKRKMIGCRIQYPTKEVQDDGGIVTRMYTEIHTEGTIVEMLDNEVSNAYPNPLGEIMVVHIPNEPLPYRKYGRSDLESLLLPNKELNEKASDFSEILAYHAAPVTVIKGARVQQLERGARKVWGGIPKDGDVFNLGLDTDLTSAITYLEMLKKHMHETGNVPEEALGALQNVSNTSAAALHVQYQPLIERTQKKQIHFGKGLRRLNELILKFYEEAGVLKFPDKIPPARKYRTEIEWGDALPRDRSIQLADISTEMGLGIESKEGALVRLGEEAPQKKLQEIREEMMDDAETQYQTAGLLGPGMGMDAGGGQQPGAGPGGDPQNDVSGAVSTANANPAVKGNNIAQQAVKKSAQTTFSNTK